MDAMYAQGSGGGTGSGGSAACRLRSSDASVYIWPSERLSVLDMHVPTAANPETTSKKRMAEGRRNARP